MTNQRMAILSTLRKRNDHPTADALYVKLRRKLPRINFSTVYRNLETLAEAGIIQKTEIAKNVKNSMASCDISIGYEILGAELNWLGVVLTGCGSI
jgi:Fe2+ or Zn2+ uptake regulation protein